MGLINPTDSYSVDENLILPLAELYQYELNQVNTGNHLGLQFDVSWTLEEIKIHFQQVGIDAGLANELVDSLRNDRRLVSLSSNRYRTDTCELVRLSTFNYPRFIGEDEMLRPTQSGVSWSLERKITPKWELSSDQVISNLETEFI